MPIDRNGATCRGDDRFRRKDLPKVSGRFPDVNKEFASKRVAPPDLAGIRLFLKRKEIFEETGIVEHPSSDEGRGMVAPLPHAARPGDAHGEE